MDGKMEPLLLKISEAAQALGISRSLAYQLARSRELPTVRIGGNILVSADALRAWVNEKFERERSGGER
jgi:excisionase family DNA binding protein